MQAEKDTALLEDEKVFIKTISLVLELLPPFTISKVGNIVKPTHGFSKKGAILNVDDSSEELLPIGIFTRWGYWKPFTKDFTISKLLKDSLLLEKRKDSYYESKRFFPEGSEFPFPDRMQETDYKRMELSFKALFKKFVRK